MFQGSNGVNDAPQRDLLFLNLWDTIKSQKVSVLCM